METIKCDGYLTIDEFNKRIKERRTIAYHAVGYYIARGVEVNHLKLKFLFLHLKESQVVIIKY